MTRTEAWVHFAAAALNGAAETPEQAGEWADTLLEEAGKRFPELQEKKPHHFFGYRLTVRAYNLLEQEGIKDDDALAALPESHFHRIRGCGNSTILELRKYLATRGRQFS